MFLVYQNANSLKIEEEVCVFLCISSGILNSFFALDERHACCLHRFDILHFSLPPCSCSGAAKPCLRYDLVEITTNVSFWVTSRIGTSAVSLKSGDKSRAEEFCLAWNSIGIRIYNVLIFFPLYIFCALERVDLHVNRRKIVFLGSLQKDQFLKKDHLRSWLPFMTLLFFQTESSITS